MNHKQAIYCPYADTKIPACDDLLWPVQHVMINIIRLQQPQGRRDGRAGGLKAQLRRPDLALQKQIPTCRRPCTGSVRGTRVGVRALVARQLALFCV